MGDPVAPTRGPQLFSTKLRGQIMQRGEKCSHIDIRPSGCLDRCEDGPVVMAFYSRLAEEANPSKELIKESLRDTAHVFTAVSARAVSTILDTILEGTD
jgi:(2Fe-2S) ferredoxin